MREYSDRERAAFARHELEQRRIEAAQPFAVKLAMLDDMQRTAMLFRRMRPAPPPAAPSPATPPDTLPDDGI